MAVSLLGVGLVFAWVWMAGGTSHTLQIDYTWGRDFLDSAEVEIDGQVVGVLASYVEGSWVTGFRVEPGEHVVRVLREGCESVPETFRLGGSDGRRATFMADVDDGLRCRVLLR
jgi:hypothetical protein